MMLMLFKSVCLELEIKNAEKIVIKVKILLHVFFFYFYRIWYFLCFITTRGKLIVSMQSRAISTAIFGSNNKTLCILINRYRRQRRINQSNVYFRSAKSAKHTFKHIDAGYEAEIAIYFKPPFPYLSRSTSLRPLRALLFPSSFPASVFRLGLRLTLPGERMAARLLGSPPAQIAFARAQNLWTAMIKSRGIIIECLSRQFRWKSLRCDDDCKFLVSLDCVLQRKETYEIVF